MGVSEPLDQGVNGQDQPGDIIVDMFLWRKYIAATPESNIHPMGKLFSVLTRLLFVIPEALYRFRNFLCLSVAVQ